MANQDDIRIGCGAMIFKNNNVLLMKRGAAARDEIGKWEFPGGAVDIEETPENAVLREVYEELGPALEISIVCLLSVDEFTTPDTNNRWRSYTYLINLISGEPQIMEPEKCSQIKWIELSEIDTNKLTYISSVNYKTFVENSDLLFKSLL